MVMVMCTHVNITGTKSGIEALIPLDKKIFTKFIDLDILYFQAKGLNLSCVRICCVIAEERPRIQLTSSFTKLFADLGLSYRAVSTSFGCRVNIGISFPVSIGETCFYAAKFLCPHSYQVDCTLLTYLLNYSVNLSIHESVRPSKNILIL